MSICSAIARVSRAYGAAIARAVAALESNGLNSNGFKSADQATGEARPLALHLLFRREDSPAGEQFELIAVDAASSRRSEICPLTERSRGSPFIAAETPGPICPTAANLRLTASLAGFFDLRDTEPYRHDRDILPRQPRVAGLHAFGHRPVHFLSIASM